MGSRRLVAYRCFFEGLTADAYGLAEKELALGRRDTDSAPTVVPEADNPSELGMRAQRNRRCIGRKPTLEPCSTLYETFGGYFTLNLPHEKE